MKILQPEVFGVQNFFMGIQNEESYLWKKPKRNP